MFTRILIANRGEIACRVIRTARRMGIETVAVYSEADAGAQHVLQADQAWPIGGPRPQDSYLRGDAIIAVALQSGAQAIHPGYGFLSENADFADAVAAAGLVFIGPSGSTMRSMGSKAGAKDLMQAAGVPVVPGYTGTDQSPDVLAREADRVGYPLMIKAAHGGGGKGMRIVHAADAFAASLESCQREARNAFGRDRVLLERYIASPRHIEIQVFGDSHGQVIHLNERECSAQRRYQKVLEESPSPFLDAAMRAAMGAAAIEAARAIDYANAGTVEFIVAPDGAFYFMEINTRLQVEHPVTEMVTGLDLVEWQLRVAAGEPLPLAQDAVQLRGHAIEVRLYAEDPEANFMPASGRLQQLRLPGTALPNVRVDAGVVEGDVVSIFYDPMIAKLIVWDVDRGSALARMRQALAQCAIVGPASNIAFLETLLRHPAVVNGSIDTSLIDAELASFLPQATHDGQALVAACTVRLLDQQAAARKDAATHDDASSPWALGDGWRIGPRDWQVLHLQFRGQPVAVPAQGHGGDYMLRIDGRDVAVDGARCDGDTLTLRVDGQVRRVSIDRDTAGGITVHGPSGRARFEAAAVYHRAGGQVEGRTDMVAAPMPGRVVLLRVAAGDAVVQGQEMLVLEAMKMELVLKAPRDGTVARVHAEAGDVVDADAVLVTLEP